MNYYNAIKSKRNFKRPEFQKWYSSNIEFIIYSEFPLNIIADSLEKDDWIVEEETVTITKEQLIIEISRLNGPHLFYLSEPQEFTIGFKE